MTSDDADEALAALIVALGDFAQSDVQSDVQVIPAWRRAMRIESVTPFDTAE
jgi:hypothetical protein